MYIAAKRGIRSPCTGFTLAEVLVSLLILSVAILALMALILSTLRAGQKSSDRPVGLLAADSALDYWLSEVKVNYPNEPAATFWNTTNSVSTPWRSGKVNINNTEFIYSLYAENIDLQPSTGKTLTIAGVPNRLKKVDVVVWWWDGQRQGYGQLRCSKSKVVNENDI